MELSPEELRGFREVFDLVDDDNSGAIDVPEVAKLMALLGMPHDPEQVGLMVREIDADGNGEVDFDEFLLVMAGGNKPAPFTRRQLLSAFSEISVDKEKTPHGCCDPARIERFLLRYCDEISEEHAKKLAYLATDEVGNVNYVERVNALMR